MNADLKRDIEDGIASLTRVMDAPSSPLGFGTDLAWTHDLELPMRDVDALSVEAIAQAILRRLDCPRGQLVDDADYGLDVRAFLHRGSSVAELARLADSVRGEVEQDDRVISAKVSVTSSSDASALSIRILITPASAERDVFSLTLAVTSAGVLLEGINA